MTLNPPKKDRRREMNQTESELETTPPRRTARNSNRIRSRGPRGMAGIGTRNRLEAIAGTKTLTGPYRMARNERTGRATA
jgi:hypothetical protein